MKNPRTKPVLGFGGTGWELTLGELRRTTCRFETILLALYPKNPSNFNSFLTTKFDAPQNEPHFGRLKNA